MTLKVIYWTIIDTAKRVAPPITSVYCFGLQNLRRHMCCRAIKTNGVEGATRLAVSIVVA